MFLEWEHEQRTMVKREQGELEEVVLQGHSIDLVGGASERKMVIDEL